MTPGWRKFALTTHLTISLGWIGAVVAYLVLGVSAVTTQDVPTVRAAWRAMELIGWFAIVPLALASLLTGLIMALGTQWGLFRHYWVLFSLVLTVLATVVLLLHMPDVSRLADVAQQAEGAALAELGGRSPPSRARPCGTARDHGAECVQAAGSDPVWVA